MRLPRRPASWLQQLSPAHGGSTQESILDALRDVILAGYAPPGSAIPVDDVADRFQVSRIPVREALKTLIGEGLVAHQPRAGYTVAQLTADELQQFYLVRGVLEVAALRAAVNHATPEDDESARSAHAALDRAVADGDPRAHQLQSRRFHLALLAPSGMQRLLHILSAAWNVTEPMQPMGQLQAGDRALLHDDHQVMLDAFVARDADRLVLASQHHYERLQTMLGSLPGDSAVFTPAEPQPPIH